MIHIKYKPHHDYDSYPITTIKSFDQFDKIDINAVESIEITDGWTDLVYDFDSVPVHKHPFLNSVFYYGDMAKFILANLPNTYKVSNYK